MIDRRRRVTIGLGAALAVTVAVLAAAVVTVLRSGQEPADRVGLATPTATGSASRSATPPAAAITPTPGGSAGFGRAPSPSPSRRSSSPAIPPMPSGDHPNAATTGVPPGTSLRRIALNDDGAYRVTRSGTVLDKVHIPGDLLITANDVTITRSQIDGMVLDEYSNQTYSFTITDSTVGPATGCLTSPGVGEADFTARRVYVRGHSDGFRASGNNIAIHDSYVDLCSNPGDHSDGIQTYLTGRGLVLNHTTIDQRDVPDMNAPIFIVDEQTVDVTVTNNLVMGGTYSIQVRNARGTVIVRNNRLVNKSWVYGPVESDCSSIDWAGNTLVTIDRNYRITSTVGPLPC